MIVVNHDNKKFIIKSADDICDDCVVKSEMCGLVAWMLKCGIEDVIVYNCVQYKKG